MNASLELVGTLIANALAKIPPPAGRGRPSTPAIYEALKKLSSVRSALSKEFGGPLKCRYAGCPPVAKKGKKRRKVLGYLWDFSFSRFGIPEAIEQDGSVSGVSRYEILLVVESELGTEDEICRDLLKLLDARATIRCLIYRQPVGSQRRDGLHSRMIRVLHNHAHFDHKSEQWLFIGLSWGPGHLAVDSYTLAVDGTSLVPLSLP